MDRCSMILEDKNIHYALIHKVIKIIKRKYNCRFNIDHLTSLQIFSIKEKEYLRSIFSSNINELYLCGEHQFNFIKDLWEYREYPYYDYKKTVRSIMHLLNKSRIPLGKTVYTNDYELISGIGTAWEMLWKDHAEDEYLENRIYKGNYAVIEFISDNLRSRVGDSCRFDFKFIKSFIEARHDYFTKELKDAIMGIKNVTID